MFIDGVLDRSRTNPDRSLSKQSGERSEQPTAQ
jgi:hypothetical protein